MSQAVLIEGKTFELTVSKQPNRPFWDWMITAPGELVLAGEAGTELQALQFAREAGETIAALCA